MNYTKCRFCLSRWYPNYRMAGVKSVRGRGLAAFGQSSGGRRRFWSAICQCSSGPARPYRQNRHSDAGGGAPVGPDAPGAIQRVRFDCLSGTGADDVFPALVYGRSVGDRPIFRARDAGAGDAGAVRPRPRTRDWLLPRLRRIGGRGWHHPSLQLVDPCRQQRRDRREIPQGAFAGSRRARALAENSSTWRSAISNLEIASASSRRSAA